MNGKYLVINAGSSSLKFSLYDMPENILIVNGTVERIGEDNSFYSFKYNAERIKKSKKINNHTEAVLTMVNELLNYKFIESLDSIKGIGHRILHGGEIYFDSVLIDDEVLNNIEKMTKFGPLHHPGELAGIKAMKEVLPDVIQVAVFDTAFHQTIPMENFMYPIPYDWYKENNVRKYGFHGTSHKYITGEMKKRLDKEDVNLIICHIGNGASVSLIKDGICYDTSMGLTPLDGLMMGTRSGSIDASILEYICNERNLSIEEATSMLNKESGLKGITGKSDFRDIEKMANEGSKIALLAIRMFQNSIIKYIAQYYFEAKGKVDAIVFTAGIGENSFMLRENIVEALSVPLEIRLDRNSNNNIAKFKDKQEGIITTNDSKIKVIVIPTDEEKMIVEDTYKICSVNKKENEYGLYKTRIY